MTAFVVDAEIILERKADAGSETMLPVELIVGVDYTPAELGSPVCPPSNEALSINALYFGGVDIFPILPDAFIEQVEEAVVGYGVKSVFMESEFAEPPKAVKKITQPEDGLAFPVAIGIEVKVGDTTVLTEFNLDAELHPDGKLLFGEVDLSEIATISGVPECGPKTKRLNNAAH